MSTLPPEIPETTAYVTLVDIVYTGYLSTVHNTTIDFSGFISDKNLSTHYLADRDTEATPPAALNSFIRALTKLGFIDAPFLQRTTRATAIQGIISDITHKNRASITFVVVTNSAMLRAICIAMARRCMHIQFIFVEHDATLSTVSLGQSNRYTILPMHEVFPDAIDATPTTPATPATPIN